MRLRTGLFIVLVVMVSWAFQSTSASASCNFYTNSMATDFDLPYGPACSGTGPGCHECYNASTGGGASSSVCVWDSPEDEYCIWFEPANQNI